MTQQRITSEKPLTQDEIRIGEEFESMEFTVSREDVDRFTWANDDYNPWYTDDSPWGGCIASPTSLGTYTLIQHYNYLHVLAPEQHDAIGGLVHAKQEYEFINPIKVGKKYKMTGRPVEKYHKNGRDYMVSEHLVVDADGKEIIRMKATFGRPIVVHR